MSYKTISIILFTLLLSSCRRLSPPDAPGLDSIVLSSKKVMSFLFENYLLKDREKYSHFSIVDGEYCYSSTIEYEFKGEIVKASYTNVYFDTILNGSFEYLGNNYDFIIPFGGIQCEGAVDYCSYEDRTICNFYYYTINMHYFDGDSFDALERVYYGYLHDEFNKAFLTTIRDKDIGYNAYHQLEEILNKNIVSIDYRLFLED